MSVLINLQVISGYWKFIQGLEWLQPESSKSYFYLDCEYRTDIPSHMKNDKASIWLYRSLESHSLSQKLSWLLSDKNHLKACYQPHAFLQQEKYAEAMLVCLRSVERNQPSLLSEINPCLFLAKVNAHEFHKIHRRCSSFPEAHLKHYEENRQLRSNTVESISKEELNVKIVDTPDGGGNSKVKVCHGKIKPWHSLPILDSQITSLAKTKISETHCKTTPSTPVASRNIPSINVFKSESFSLQNSKRKSNSRKNIARKSNKPKHVVINNYEIIEHTPPLSSSQSSGTYVNEELSNLSTKSLPETKSPMRKIISLKSVPDYAWTTKAGQKDYKRHPRKSFIESGGMSIQPVATG